MNELEILDKINDLMTEFGPDGHIDGSDIITGYIMTLLEEADYTTDLEEFHNMFGIEVNKKPTQVTLETALLRVNLIQEELNELYDAYNEEDLVKQLDAYVDLLYVVFGSIVSSGMQHIIQKAFKECHRSNMTKVLDENNISEHQTLLDSGEVRLEHIEETKYRLIRNSDGKVIKPNGYNKANFEQFLK